MALIRVLLADDHALVRAGFRSLLEQLGGIQVVAEASDGYQALELVQTHKPDIALIDIAMPALNGFEATARIIKESPHTRVIILSMHSAEEYARRALQAGAAGYVLKNASPSELELAIRSVARGDVYLTPPISKHIVADYKQHLRERPTSFDRLTQREREILQLIAEGHRRKEIAKKLNISTKTFDTYRYQLMQKLDIHDVPGLVRYAARMGLVIPAESDDNSKP